ncbi:hypothetical protein FOA52_002764 [Chlamydomonas sp. UWO 241]|nr:hypothetical protein FOA52_002764 [Chlamydomonas sp. UWO 241]
MRQPVYLIDLAAYKPPNENKANMDVAIAEFTKKYSPESMDFQTRVIAKSGLSRYETYLPHSINPSYCGLSPITDLKAAEEECRMTTIGALTDLLAKTGLAASDIDILVTTCSIYCPTPSIGSMLVNTFRMRSDVQSYSLGGMGCSNGVVGMSLVRDLLQAHPNANVVFVTTEVTSNVFYPGQDRARQVTNLLFRMGAAAVLFSNNASWGSRIKYRLRHSERVHIGASDAAYSAIHYSPDEEGINGVYLGKDVVTEASRALGRVIRNIGPKVLSKVELLRYAHNAATRWVGRKLGSVKIPEYVPTFSGSLDHFLIHAGGAKVLDGLGDALRLTVSDLEASRAVLFDYGNVSSSSTWYTLGYVESVRGVKRGDRVMQIGVGSGIKCGVNIWQATRDISDVHRAWEHRVAPERAAAAAAKTAAKPPRRFVDTSGRWSSSLALAFVALLLALLMGVCLVLDEAQGDISARIARVAGGANTSQLLEELSGHWEAGCALGGGLRDTLAGVLASMGSGMQPVGSWHAGVAAATAPAMASEL